MLLNKFWFVVSCDLRNIVRTINELPDDYSGQINFLLNDEPIVVARNIVLLVILALSPDKAKAVEHAVHVWYSSFVPMDCEIEIKSMWTAFSSAFRNEGTNTYFNTPISDTSTISGRVTQDVVEQLRKVLRVKHDRAKAQVEWNRTVYVSLPSFYHNVSNHHHLGTPRQRATCTMRIIAVWSHRIALHY
jgi:hypothetical protein